MFVPTLPLFSVLELGCISRRSAGESEGEAVCFLDLRLPDKSQREEFSSESSLLRVAESVCRAAAEKLVVRGPHVWKGTEMS